MDVYQHDTIQHYTQIQIKVQEQLVVRKDMDVNEHERLSNLTLKDTNYRKGTACSKKGYGCK